MQILYENILSKAKKEVKDFFKNTAKFLKRNAKKIYKELDTKYGNHKKPTNFMPGKLLHYRYEAKHREHIFDRNPLLLCLGRSKKHPNTHFIGINFHWLPMENRVAIASFFLELRKARKGKLIYEDVKPFISKFNGHPALRMYIIKNVSEKVIEVPDDMFLVAAGLPTEMFVSYGKAVMSKAPNSKAKEKKIKKSDLVGKNFKSFKI